jgi:hypothetical protein
MVHYAAEAEVPPIQRGEEEEQEEDERPESDPEIDFPERRDRNRLLPLFFAVGVTGFLAVVGLVWMIQASNSRATLILEPEQQRVEVFLNNDRVSGTARIDGLKPGNYQLRVTKTGHRPFTRQITLVADTPTAIHLPNWVRESDTGTLILQIDPSGAAAIIDGKEVSGATSIRLKAGVHQVRVTKDHYAPFERRIEVSAHEVQMIPVSLTPIKEVAQLVLEINVSGATVFLDSDSGVAAESTRFMKDGLHAGLHQLRVSKDGYEPCAKNVILIADEPKTIQVQLRKRESPEPTQPQPQPETGTIVLEVDQVNAEVLVNEERVGITSAQDKTVAIARQDGTYRVVVRRKGFVDFKKTVTARAGKNERLQVKLRQRSESLKLRSRFLNEKGFQNTWEVQAKKWRLENKSLRIEEGFLVEFALPCFHDPRVQGPCRGSGTAGRIKDLRGSPAEMVDHTQGWHLLEQVLQRLRDGRPGRPYLRLGTDERGRPHRHRHHGGHPTHASKAPYLTVRPEARGVISQLIRHRTGILART